MPHARVPPTGRHGDRGRVHSRLMPGGRKVRLPRCPPLAALYTRLYGAAAATFTAGRGASRRAAFPSPPRSGRRAIRKGAAQSPSYVLLLRCTPDDRAFPRTALFRRCCVVPQAGAHCCCISNTTTRSQSNVESAFIGCRTSVH